jgi:hypothetical protein
MMFFREVPRTKGGGSLSGNSNCVSVLISILIQHIIIPMLNIVVILWTEILRSKEGTLNIFYCQAVIQTMDQTQVINIRGLLRKKATPL